MAGNKPTPIALQDVKSSNIAAVGYDAGAEVFAVQFKSGPAQYQYRGVSPKLAQQIQTAPSIGSAVSKLLVKGGYESTRIEPEK